MQKKEQDHRGELKEVMNALAEAAAEASNKELLAEVQEAGLDLKAEAESIRAILLRSVSKFKRKKLEQARRDYEIAASSLFTKHYPLPETPQERRNLLINALTIQPEMQSMLTVQFRELDMLSDEDIESSLRKLAELGMLDDLSDKSNKE